MQRLQAHINHIAVLVHSPPKVMLLAVDLHEDFVDVEGIVEAEPNGVDDDIWRETMALISIHPPILAIRGS